MQPGFGQGHVARGPLDGGEPIDSITGAIIGSAISLHRELGPGLLESTYERCLSVLVAAGGLAVERQVVMPLIFHGHRLDHAYRLDLLVESRVVVEIKTVTVLDPVHIAQMVTYLKLSGCAVGLIMNFNVARLTDGIRRVLPGRTRIPSPSLPVPPTSPDIL
jgi:GxxExxY protein